MKDGKKVSIEAERKPYCFVNHKHDKNKVDIMIVMADDDTPRELLPRTIIVVDPVELEERTREARRHYAENVAPITNARREAKQRMYRDPNLFMLGIVRGALRELYCQLSDDEIYEHTEEDVSMEEATLAVALKYLQHYSLCTNAGNGTVVPEIVSISHRISKHGIEGLSERECDHIALWLSILRDEYAKRV